MSHLTLQSERDKVIQHPEALAAADHVTIYRETGIRTSAACLSNLAERLVMREQIQPCLFGAGVEVLRGRLQTGGGSRVPAAHGMRQLSPIAAAAMPTAATNQPPLYAAATPAAVAAAAAAAAAATAAAAAGAVAAAAHGPSQSYNAIRMREKRKREKRKQAEEKEAAAAAAAEEATADHVAIDVMDLA